MNNPENRMEIIAGPCSAESEQQILATAAGLAAIGVRTMRAGIWKPRSRSGSFEGYGADALPWLEAASRMYGMQTMTEVAVPRHVEAVLRHNISRIWIGARTTVNPFMMSELAESLRGVNIPVFVKNPVCPDAALWIGAVERLLKVGISDVSLIHRGFCLQDNAPYRNTPLWNVCNDVLRELGDIPIYCDPSHIAGRRELLEGLCAEALRHNIRGFFIESHCCPDAALSDAAQQITPVQLGEMIEKVGMRL